MNATQSNIITDEIIRQLYIPETNSHKGDNGKLLIIAGDEKYHGALLLAVEIASRIIDLVYVSSVLENNRLVEKLKSHTAEFITIDRSLVVEKAGQADAILVGPGMEQGDSVEKIVNDILKKYPKKKTVLDAGALKVISPSQLHSNCIITPHQQEFETLFSVSGSVENVKKMAEQYNCTIILKSVEDIIASADQLWINKTGNVGMTKGGTGDVLAGLVAALACKNNLLISALAGTYINGVAGDELYKKRLTYYNATDIVQQIPRIIFEKNEN